MEKLFPSYADDDQRPAVSMQDLDGEHAHEHAIASSHPMALTTSSFPRLPPLRLAEMAAAPAVAAADPRLPKLRNARRAHNDAFERAYVLAALEATNQNVTRAAKLAGVSRQQIQRLMIKHGVRRGDPVSLTPAPDASSCSRR